MTTPNLNLTLPNAGERNTAQALNDNFAAIETACAPLENISGNHGLEVVDGELRAKVGNGLSINASGEIQGASANLKDLSDVSITSPANSDYLYHDGTSWINSAGYPIDGLEDVEITNPQVGDYLKWDGSKWVNVTPGTITSIAALPEFNISSPVNGQTLQWNGSKFVNADYAITDVELGALVNGQGLLYTSGKWKNATGVALVGSASVNSQLYWGSTNFLGAPNNTATPDTAPNFSTTYGIKIGASTNPVFQYNFTTGSPYFHLTSTPTTYPTYTVAECSFKRYGNIGFVEGRLVWTSLGTASILIGMIVIPTVAWGNYFTSSTYHAKICGSIGASYDYMEGRLQSIVGGSLGIRLKGHKSGAASQDISIPNSGSVFFSCYFQIQ